MCRCTRPTGNWRPAFAERDVAFFLEPPRPPLTMVELFVFEIDAPPPFSTRVDPRFRSAPALQRRATAGATFEPGAARARPAAPRRRSPPARMAASPSPTAARRTHAETRPGDDDEAVASRSVMDEVEVKIIPQARAVQCRSRTPRGSAGVPRRPSLILARSARGQGRGGSACRPEPDPTPRTSAAGCTCSRAGGGGRWWWLGRRRC